MKRRIFISMFLLTMASLLALSVSLCAVFYNQLSSSVFAEVRKRAAILKVSVTSENADALMLSDMRLTIVASNGRVEYDNDQAADSLPNHADREEIKEAQATGIGESRRYSDTLGQETFYYAVKLESGSILRLAKTIKSMWGMFQGVIPIVLAMVLVMFAIGYILAGRLTRRIVDPINDVRIDDDLTAPYDELAPFVRTIARQRERIGQQVSDLKSRADTIEAIMNSVSEGIVLVDAQGRVLSVNQSANAIFSLTDSVKGMSLIEILRDVEMNETMHAALVGVRSEMNLDHAGKTYRVYFSPAPGSGAMILFWDITEKTHTEQLRREFSANVSHELKTPLTTIYGNAEMLENGMVMAEDAPQFYQKIKGEAERLITLIDDIIMLSRLDENSGDAHTENVDLLDTATEVIESLEPKARQNNVSVTISGGGVFQANHAQMTELFYNLIDNAIKYNKPGGAVKIDIKMISRCAKITVSDTGIGIPMEVRDRVFERFYRVDKSRSKETGGTGLGLAIVKHIVMAYTGKIELSGFEGQGICVTVWLNAAA